MNPRKKLEAFANTEGIPKSKLSFEGVKDFEKAYGDVEESQISFDYSKGKLIEISVLCMNHTKKRTVQNLSLSSVYKTKNKSQ